MMAEEKKRLVAWFADRGRWCREAEARDSTGNPVRFDDPDAVAWDLTGALCRLFGWTRASILFGQLDRHISGKKRLERYNRNREIESMVALQDYNDREDTTLEAMLRQLGTMPVRQEAPLQIKEGGHPLETA